MDLGRLISIIEFDHQNQTKTRNLLLPNVSSTGKEEEDTDHDDRCIFQFSLKDLVTTGELQYNNIAIRQVAIDIANTFKTDSNRDYNTLLLEALSPMMYLLKHEQNLADFCSPLKSSLSKERDIRKSSQRMFVWIRRPKNIVLYPALLMFGIAIDRFYFHLA